MDFLIFLGVVSGIGFACSVPIAVFMYVRAKTRPSQIGEEHLQALHARMDELDELQRRLSEVEERLDFAERVLARPEIQKLTPG
jgi:hypothetical protein